ncbi:hypothetical protein [Streptomyces prasinus]|uniref:hypothetical protein n=1 Tax=Streptomyces prasinus TaxID=67345 RepID=UPI0033B0207E
MLCTICDDVATHYYVAISGEHLGKCAYHAETFGASQYLVEINPPVRMRTPGFLIQFADGKGGGIDPISDIWPFDDANHSEWWVTNVTGCYERDASWLVDDAMYDPYRPQYLETQHVTAEVTRVTLLPVLDDCVTW